MDLFLGLQSFILNQLLAPIDMANFPLLKWTPGLSIQIQNLILSQQLYLG